MPMSSELSAVLQTLNAATAGTHAMEAAVGGIGGQVCVVSIPASEQSHTKTLWRKAMLQQLKIMTAEESDDEESS